MGNMAVCSNLSRFSTLIKQLDKFIIFCIFWKIFAIFFYLDKYLALWCVDLIKLMDDFC